jgi:hypothetical protein
VGLDAAFVNAAGEARLELYLDAQRLGLAPGFAVGYHSLETYWLRQKPDHRLLAPQGNLGYTYDYTFPVGFKGF